MKIFLNNEPVELPSTVKTVAEIVEWKKFPAAATAVAINDKIVIKSNWSLCKPEPLDRVTIISAAFGG